MQSVFQLDGASYLWHSRRHRLSWTIKILTQILPAGSCKFEHPGAGGSQQSNRFGALGGGNAPGGQNARGLGKSGTAALYPGKSSAYSIC